MTDRKRTTIVGTFTTKSPLHVGSGYIGEDQRLLNEKNEKNCEIQSVVRDFKKQPCIPGSAIKGVLRSWATKYFPNSIPIIDRIFGPEDCEQSGWAEFGTAFFERLGGKQYQYDKHVPYWYNQLVPADREKKTRKDRTLFTGVLSHVAIERATGAAEANKLFFEEFVPEGVSFTVEITTTRLHDDEIGFLLGLLATGSQHEEPYQFGANGADGWGRVEWVLQSVSRQITEDTIKPTSDPSWSLSKVTLAFEGPFLVNDTSKAKQPDMLEADKASHANFTALKRADGNVWLPASSFRGAFRSRFEFFANSLGQKDSIERVFGKTSQASCVHLTEFQHSGGQRKLEFQDFVAIDRFTGGAADGAKFDALYALRPTFTSTLRIKTTHLKKNDLNLIAATLQSLQKGDITFGFGGSKGYGRATATFDPELQKWITANLLQEQVLTFSSTTTTSATTNNVTPIPPTPATAENIKPGTLICKMKGNNTEWILEVTTKKGSAEIRGIENIIPMSIKRETFDRLAVEFEPDISGRPIRIRKQGETWLGSTTPGSSVSTQLGQFANPYYFIPSKERGQFTGELKDQSPLTNSPHLKYLPGRYSGHFKVKLTTATPLIICARPENEQAQHKIYPILIQDGRPLLASSSVRGMLRSAYEVITNSRFGVFPFKTDESTGHARRLAYRRTAKVDVEPAIIEEATSERIVIRILSQLWLKSPAKLPRYSPSSRSIDKGESNSALKYSNGKLPESGDQVFVKVDDNGRVTQIQLAEGNVTPTGWYSGYVLITNANINSKRYERVFVFTEQDKKLTVLGDEAKRIHSLWTDLIADYQDIHERDLQTRKTSIPPRQPQDYLGPEPGKTAWSRHVYLEEYRKLLPTMRVYIRREKDKVTDVFPVSISRKLYEKSPFNLLPATLQPATNITQLSPADRVFGWVSQDTNTVEQPAFRSPVSVGVVTCITSEAKVNEAKTLAILGQPKPAQGRFYLGSSNGKAHLAGGTKEGSGYSGGNRIRGPKIYPHHAKGVDSDYAYREEKDTQNRTITDHVKPGTEFEFELRFTNLTALELGALVWLLQLPAEHYHRLGLGKPFGFGSVRLEIASSVVATGESWMKTIGTPNTPEAITDFSGLKQQFETAINSANSELLPAFMKAAKGFDSTPIHYPRLPDQNADSGEQFQWFGKNESGQKLSLPDLSASIITLPRNPSNK